MTEEHITGIVLADLALLLSVAFVFVKLAARFGQPAVIGEIVAGITLGPSVLGLLPGNLTETLFPAEARPYLQVLAQVGLVLFMFGVGYQLSPSEIRGRGGQVTLVSLTSVIVPFAMGMGLAVLLYPWFDRSQLRTDGVIGPALFLGAAMSITAFPVLARIITERGLQKSRLGAVALTSAAIQDFLAWCVLAVVVAIVTAGGSEGLAWTAAASAGFLVAMLYVVRPALTWLLAPARKRVMTHTTIVCGLLTSAWITDWIGLHVVFGAFLFGAVVPRHHIDARSPEVPERIEQTSLLLLPAFFTVTGLSVDLGGLGAQGALMAVAVVVVACAGKFAGATVAARLTGAGPRDSAVLGVLLNTRGLTELIILNVGLGLGVLDTRLFTAMVVMALFTTLIAGPLLTRLYPVAPQEPSGDVVPSDAVVPPHPLSPAEPDPHADRTRHAA
ncbi:cation:proton antiporter [Actinomadura fulvescens]|uniref:Cation/H+ exchanger transmembrane domain-containing protein n=1 Tax=Actinomadura fulvescens TaxID=46160 RepID=A0ABP6BQ49_9ACTN